MINHQMLDLLRQVGPEVRCTPDLGILPFAPAPEEGGINAS